MMGTRFLASFGRLLTGSATAAQVNDSADIELHDLSSGKGTPAARAAVHSSGPASTTPLLDRICKQLSSSFKAAMRDIHDFLNDPKKQAAKPGASAKDHGELIQDLKKLLPHMATQLDDQAKIARAANPATTKQRSASELATTAKKLPSHQVDRQGGNIGKARRRTGDHVSRYRLATLKEALAKESGKRRPADTFIKRMNHLQFQGRLAGQLEELNLHELMFLWSKASKGSENFLSPEARKTLCEKGHLRLCRAFQAEARQYGRDPAGLNRALPRWAARAPAEWHPKEALQRAYCVE